MKNIYQAKSFRSLAFSLFIGFLFLLVSQKNVLSQGAGNCLNFDGVDDYVSITQNSGLPIYNNGSNNAYTVEFWVIGSGSQVEGVIFSEANNGPNYPADATPLFKLSTGTTGNEGLLAILIRENNNDRPIDNDLSTSTVFDGSWHHVAWVDDNGSTSLYIDGQLDNTVSDYDPDTVTVTLNTTTIAGVNRSGTVGITNEFAGRIDEVRIWNDARTESEIRDNMCRKLTGSESNLVAYYRFDASTGTSLSDLTGNSNTGTLQNMEDSDWVTSAAAIGDVSAYNYSSPFNINLPHPDGDDMTVSSVTGSPTCVHVYYVDEAPNITTPPATWNNLDPLRYWGVFVPGGTSPTYTVQYNYDGHPGIVNENTLALATRTGGDATTWTDAGATLSTGDNTLTTTGQAGRVPQYILGSTNGDNPLPVELASFTANLVSEGIQLQWTTFSEIENDGFEIWRSIDNDQDFQYLAGYQNNPALVGAGNSNTTHEYSYLDNDIRDGHTYYYQLWDVSFGGERVSHAPVAVTLNQIPDAAQKFVLFQNYPNPFNPITYIRFQINDIKSSYGTAIPVVLNVYDLLGRKVKTLLNEDLNVGDYTLYWDGTNEFNQNVASGSYIYMLQIGDQKITKQLVLVR